MRPTIAEISLMNLNYNFLNIRKKVKKTRVLAVVKADAYGHGSIECTKALLNLGKKRPDYFGVALLEEAIEIRKPAPKEPILCFAPLDLAYLKDYIENDIEATICRIETIRQLRFYNGPRIKIHVNVDTGMGRLGIRFDEAFEAIELLSKIPGAQIAGIYTHFATSDQKDKTFANLQLQRFTDLVNKLKQNEIECGLVHAANSGAILDMPESYFDMVRVGISLYGYYPSLQTSESIKLKPVMSLYSKVDSVKDILKNDSVSYGRKFVAKVKTKSATIPIGYADGINRNLTNSMNAIIKGKLYKQIGTVTMDRIAFNVTRGSIRVGDNAILLGKSKKIEINAWDWCKVLDTIPYEITCNISKRVPRIFKWS